MQSYIKEYGLEKAIMHCTELPACSGLFTLIL